MEERKRRVRTDNLGERERTHNCTWNLVSVRRSSNEHRSVTNNKSTYRKCSLPPEGQESPRDSDLASLRQNAKEVLGRVSKSLF